MPRPYDKVIRHKVTARLPLCSLELKLLKCKLLTGAGSPDIILLGERTLVMLNSQGQMRWQKRFDYQPVAFTTYLVSATSCHCADCLLFLQHLCAAHQSFGILTKLLLLAMTWLLYEVYNTECKDVA